MERKNLLKLTGLAAVGLGLVFMNQHRLMEGPNFTAPQYHFAGEIDGEQVRFREIDAIDPGNDGYSKGPFYGHQQIIDVTKEDGTRVSFNLGNDLKVDTVKVVPSNGVEFIYDSRSTNADVQDNLLGAQTDVDFFLEEINLRNQQKFYGSQSGIFGDLNKS